MTKNKKKEKKRKEKEEGYTKNEKKGTRCWVKYRRDS